MMSRAQDKRFWLAGGAALALVIVVVGWLAVISPQRASTSTLRGEADSARTQNTVLAAKVASLKRQNENVGKLKNSLRAALAALPFDTGLPTFTRQVAAQATQSKVSLTSILVGEAAAIAATAPTVPTTATPTAGGTASAATVMAIPITLLSDGSGERQLAFLKAIQRCGPRRALVSSTTLGTSSSTGSSQSIDKSATMTTQLTVFTAPLDAAKRAQLAKLLKAK